MRTETLMIAQRFSKWLAVCAALTSALPLVARGQDDWRPGAYMRESMIKILAAAAVVQKDTDFGFWDTCYLGAFLRQGNHSFLSTTLEQGKTYAFIGAGNKQALDVDIIIEDEQGEIVQQDVADGAVAAVAFTPQTTQIYTIRLKLHQATEPCFCGMALMKKGGWDIPVQNLDQAMDRVLRSCENIARQTPIKFLDMPGEWAMSAQVVRPGQTGGFTDIRMGTGRRILTCGGDSTIEDIDLWLYDHANPGTALKLDTDPDPVPFVDYRTTADKRYGFLTKNVKSRGPGLIMTAQLHAQ